MEQRSARGANPTASVPKLEFVNLDGRMDRHDLAARKAVREAAMRAFRRRERLQRAEAYQREKAGQIRSGPPLIPGVRCTIEASGMQVFALCIGNDVGNASDGEHEGVLVRWEKDDPSFPPVPPLRGTLDPCGTRSVGISQSKHYLLDHFVSVIAARPFRFQTDKEQSPIGVNWARKVLRDPILLEATVLNASVHLDGLYEQQASPMTLRHRGETIRLVNNMLTTQEQSTCDSVIAAVTLMAWDGNYNAETMIHMDALAFMVRMRGGLEHLGFGGILKMLIRRLDLIVAATTMSPPRFSTLAGTLAPKTALTLNTSLLEPTLLDHVPSVSAPIPAIFSKIRFLTTMQERFERERTAPDNVVLFGKIRASIGHDLLSCQRDIARTDSPEDDGYLYESCRIAAILFTEYTLAGRRPNQAILSTFGQRLNAILDEAQQLRGIQRRWDTDCFLSNVLLWVYFIGGLVTSVAGEMPRYAKRICHCMAILKLESWDGVKTCLVELLWTEKMQDQGCAVLWNEVQRSGAENIME